MLLVCRLRLDSLTSCGVSQPSPGLVPPTATASCPKRPNQYLSLEHRPSSGSNLHALCLMDWTNQVRVESGPASRTNHMEYCLHQHSSSPCCSVTKEQRCHVILTFAEAVQSIGISCFGNTHVHIHQRFSVRITVLSCTTLEYGRHGSSECS